MTHRSAPACGRSGLQQSPHCSSRRWLTPGPTFTVFKQLVPTRPRSHLRATPFARQLAAGHRRSYGDFGGLRREINWDGVPDARADPNPLPADFFNVNSPRGVVFSTPGSASL